jgi:hypothetical protein
MVWGQNENGAVKELLLEAKELAWETVSRFCEMRCVLGLASQALMVEAEGSSDNAMSLCAAQPGLC